MASLTIPFNQGTKPANTRGMAQTATDAQPASEWHAVSVADTARSFECDPTRGLTAAEVSVRLNQFGPNRLSQAKKWTRAKRLGRQFTDVLIWLLLVAAAVSGFVLEAWVDAAAIAAIVILNAVIGYAQESRADRALESLRNLEAPNATVRRDDDIHEIDARDLVPGDIVLLESGDQVPADARVLEAVRAVANEASLTGESIPVSKSPDPTLRESSLGDRTSMVYAGTTIVAGRGTVIVVGTGQQTEMGKIAALFTDEQPITPLQVELGRVGRRLAVIAVAAALLIFGAGLLRDFPIETMALTAVALAVAAIPEGLPAVVTVSLAGGLQRMAQKNAIVRRLPAVETLGAVDVICTDKTGTLTAPELKVGTVVLADGRKGTDLLGQTDVVAESLATIAALCSDATITGEGLVGDPTETALLSGLVDAGIDFSALRITSPRLDEGGFDGRRKRMSTLHEGDGGFVLHVKGAPEVLIDRSTRILTPSGAVPLSTEASTAIHSWADEIARNGMRTLAFATRTLASRPSDPVEHETELTFVGLVGLNERIREEVPEAIERARLAGVRTVMVTGDHATTAAAVGDSVGLRAGQVMGGADLAATSTQELQDGIQDFRVFARVDPADKVKIIEAWQKNGSTVAMTGDGVNDAPALHRADIGVAMGSGTDVARESSAMVLADDNYSTIVSAIAEGRRIFSNLRNVVHYLLSANASEVIYVLSGFLIFGYLGEPLLAIQLLWINLLSDAMPAIALGMDVPARDLMKDRPGVGRDVLSPRNLSILLTQGLILALAALGSMIVGTYVLDLEYETVRTMVFCTLVFSQLLHAMSVRAGSGPMRRPGRLLLLSLWVSAILQFVVVYTTFGNEVFHTQPLDSGAMTWVLAASVGSMGVVRIFNIMMGRFGNSEV